MSWASLLRTTSAMIAGDIEVESSFPSEATRITLYRSSSVTVRL
jgi:hypothetical protein